MENLRYTKRLVTQAQPMDLDAILDLVQDAFRGEIYSDQQEHFLDQHLHQSKQFIPELALVATEDNQIVGYILLSPIIINHPDSSPTHSLALAPVAVLKSHQNNGIGKMLPLEAHRKAKELQQESIILLGHPDYYSKFGYQSASNFGISLPFDVPSEFCKAIELKENSLLNCSGTVVYPPEFGI